MNLMDITKKFATPEACVHFLEGMQWQSLVVWRSCCCQVDNRAVYFRANCAEIHVGPRFAAYTRLLIPKTLQHPWVPA